MLDLKPHLVVAVLAAGCVVQTDQLEGLPGPAGDVGEQGPDGPEGPEGPTSDGNFMLTDADTGTSGDVAVAGAVGIGTSAPASGLRISNTAGATVADPLLTLGGDGFSADWQFLISDGGGAGPAGTLRMTSAGTGLTELAVTSDGRLGIGTADPQAELHLVAAGNTAVARLQSGAVAWDVTVNSTTGRLTFVDGATANTPLKIGAGADENLLILGASASDAVEITGRLIVNTTELNVPDYVFAPDYELESIAEHAHFMWTHRHLPAVLPHTVDASGTPTVDVLAQSHGTLEELEKAHIYIEQLDRSVNALKTENETLRAKLDKLETDLDERLTALEKRTP